MKVYKLFELFADRVTERQRSEQATTHALSIIKKTTEIPYFPFQNLKSRSGRQPPNTLYLTVLIANLTFPKCCIAS